MNYDLKHYLNDADIQVRQIVNHRRIAAPEFDNLSDLLHEWYFETNRKLKFNVSMPEFLIISKLDTFLTPETFNLLWGNNIKLGPELCEFVYLICPFKLDLGTIAALNDECFPRSQCIRAPDDFGTRIRESIIKSTKAIKHRYDQNRYAEMQTNPQAYEAYTKYQSAKARKWFKDASAETKKRINQNAWKIKKEKLNSDKNYHFKFNQNIRNKRAASAQFRDLEHARGKRYKSKIRFQTKTNPQIFALLNAIIKSK